MGPVSAEIEIDVSRDRAFATIADLALRPSFTGHFVDGFHLTRIESTGVGAGARFRFRLPPRSVWVDTTIVELEAPHRIVERGRGGRGNGTPSTTVWELTEGAGSLARVRVSHWSEPSSPLERALETFGGASVRLRRDWAEALRRLRDMLESGEPVRRRVAVAGGNAHATGIP
jgi:uncharacterized protein YndB with AHSA1/START domain